MIKFPVQIINRLVICLHWRRLTSGVYPDNNFVLKRMRKLVSGKQDIGVSVQLHAEDVADSVLLSLDGEGRRIDDLRVPLIRNPSGTTKRS